MGLPIAVGGKALSSRSIARPAPVPEDSDDGVHLEPRVLDCAARVCTAVSSDRVLSATCTITYQDMIRQDNGDCERTVAEVHIQISPLAQAFSSAYRDVLHRIPMPNAEEDEVNDDDDGCSISPACVFLSDGRHFACLIPHPHARQQSVLVMFQLRKPKSTTMTTIPPRPSYLPPAPSTPEVPVATNPSIVKMPNGVVLGNASAISSVSTCTSQSMLLAASTYGSIVVISNRNEVAGILYQTYEAISSLEHFTIRHDDEHGSRGKLVVLDASGSASIFSSHLVVSSSSSVILMQLQLDYKLHGSYVKAKWMGPSLLALLLPPPSTTAVQVWAMAPEQPSEPISSLIMTRQRLQECAHGSFSLDGCDFTGGSFHEATSLDYDQDSGSLAVSSVASDHHASFLPFACIWHWRTNVVGLTLAGRWTCDDESVWQRLYYSHDDNGGKVLVHLLRSKRIRKELYTLALLSPSETMGNNSACEPPSSFMISSTCVTFPCIMNPFTDGDAEFLWKDARIPASYISSYQVPQIASMGRTRCRSIAVASSRGVCVLDCARMVSNADTRTVQPKWRLFGSETDERAFRVLAMTWWEGVSAESANESQTDDLLIAVIELVESDDSDAPRGRYLACWSRRRLDLNSQMMTPHLRNGSAGQSTQSWGIPLPTDFDPNSFSLLFDPSTDLDLQTKRKAVLLISSRQDSGNRSGSIDYQLYQLEVHKGEQEVVVGSLCSDGELLVPASPLEQTATSVFLASASFDFSSGDVSSQRSDAFLATVGVIRSPGDGLEAIMITSSGVHSSKELIPASRDCGKSVAECEVSSFWLAHTSLGRRVHDNGRLDRFFVWSVELCDGSLLCWTVPYVTQQLSKPVSVTSIEETEHTTNRANGHGSSTAHQNGDSRNTFNQWLFGSVTPIGDSSCWIQQASSANRTGFSLGCLPNSSFGCTVRCAQSGRQIHRIAPDDESGNLTTLDHEVFCLGSTELAPPSCVPALFASFLREAERVGADPFERGRSVIDLSATATDAFNAFRSGGNEETLVVALRLLIIRTVELIAKESSRKDHDVASRHALFLATTVFADVVHAARRFLSPVQFASLFLGLGRQIEPSHLPHLFPLPYDRQMADHQCDVSLSVGDLFLSSVRDGSISVPSSSLPLFSSRRYSVKMCGNLLSHCLVAFGLNSGSPESLTFDISIEERRLVRSIFRFGVKMEDSGSIPHLEGLNERDPLSFDENEMNGDGPHSVGEGSVHIVTKPKNSSRICQLLFPSMLFGSYAQSKQEEEIFEAASTFILSGFDELDHEFDAVPNGDFATVHRQTDSYESDEGEATMAGIVASFLLRLAFSSESTKPRCRWNRTSALAECLLGANSIDRDSSSTSEMVHDAMNLAEILSVDEFAPALRISFSSTRAAELSLQEQALVHFLKRHLVECESDISTSKALSILHLVLVLLSRHHMGADMETHTPGLLLLCVVVAHNAGYISELLDKNGVLPTAYRATLDTMQQHDE